MNKPFNFDVEQLNILNLVEALLLATPSRLTLQSIANLVNEYYLESGKLIQPLTLENFKQILESLQEKWQTHYLQLNFNKQGWQFLTSITIAPLIDKLYEEKPQKYSKAMMETLATIVYKQPVTRGDIEAIRGVSIAPQMLKTLEQRGWIEVIGQREVPGRPNLYATTQQFLYDLNMDSLANFPALKEQTLIEDAEKLSASIEKAVKIENRRM